MSGRVPGTILVLNGPNLNRLGKRDPRWYGTDTLESINSEVEKLASDLGMETKFFQSNVEGEMIDCIQKQGGEAIGVVINAGAWTHTSIALRDAIDTLTVPVVEVHLSNVYAREKFRHKSVLEDIVTGKILGFGKESYLLAIRAVHAMQGRKNQTS